MSAVLNTIICMLNSKYIHSSLAPWYLLAGIEAYGDQSISAEVVEGTVNMALQDVADRIISKKPQVIGLCCYIWNIAFIKKLLPVIKAALPDAVIILGGPEVSFNAGAVLREEPLVDYVITGEGEKPFAQLLSALNAGMDDSCTDALRGNNTNPTALRAAAFVNANGGNTPCAKTISVQVHGIPGICHRVDGQPVIVPPYCPTDEPPNPYTDAYFKALNGRIAYLETSRGCPFLCAFCLSGRMDGIRFFDMERAKRDLLLLANSGTQTIKLVDRTFNVDRRRAREIFSFIIENYGKAIPDNVCFHFEIAGDLLDDETFDLLAAAPSGALQFEIGLQSFNPKTLEAINRKTDIDCLKRNIARLVSLGNSHIHIDLIAGLPYEDLSSFTESFNTAYALKPQMLQLGFLKLLHGSSMREEPDEFPCRYSQDPPYAVIETPWLSGSDLNMLHDTEDALERLYNSGRFRRTLEYTLKQTGMTPFKLFSSTGAFLAANIKANASLDDFTRLTYDYFGTLSGMDKAALRDAMVCDRLATNSTGRLPKALQITDDKLKKTVNVLSNQEATRPAKGIKRGYALLYSEGAAVYANYTAKDPVSGEYELMKIRLQ